MDAAGGADQEAGPPGEEEAVLEAAADALAADGPMTLDVLVERLAGEEPGGDPRRVREVLLGPRGPYRLADGRLCHRPSVADSMVLTHWLTPVEIRSGLVAAEPDLVGLVLVADQGLAIIGGGELSFTGDGSPTAMIGGPDGWLEAAEGGELLAVTVVGHFLSVMIGPGVRDELAEPTTRALRGTWEALRELGHERVELPDLLLEARAHDPDVLDEPAPPLAELLPRAGLRLDGSVVVSSGGRSRLDPSGGRSRPDPSGGRSRPDPSGGRSRPDPSG